MAAGSAQREGAEAFTAPEQVNQRRYEALRAFFVDGLGLRRSRRAVRLHPVGDGGPGTRYRAREAGAVRPAAQARPAARHGAGQGPRPGPGDRAAPRGPVHLRDLRAAREREHPAQPHRRGRDPRRGGIRAAAAPPRARGERFARPPPGATPGCRAPRGWTSDPGPPQWKPARPGCCC